MDFRARSAATPHGRRRGRALPVRAAGTGSVAAWASGLTARVGMRWMASVLVECAPQLEQGKRCINTRRRSKYLRQTAIVAKQRVAIVLAGRHQTPRIPPPLPPQLPRNPPATLKPTGAPHPASAAVRTCIHKTLGRNAQSGNTSTSAGLPCCLGCPWLRERRSSSQSNVQHQRLSGGRTRLRPPSPLPAPLHHGHCCMPGRPCAVHVDFSTGHMHKVRAATLKRSQTAQAVHSPFLPVQTRTASSTYGQNRQTNALRFALHDI